MNQSLQMFTTTVKGVAHSLFTWDWTKRFLHWLIISAGTVAECVFLIASLWISVNASVHTFVLLFIDETTTQHLTELATAAYVALPELILALACVVTISHVRLWLYDRKNYAAFIWSVLYGLPTLVFLVLSLVTLGSSVLSVNFRLPVPLVVVRALAGYMFAFTSLLYTQLGLPQERDRLQKKDALLAALRNEKDAFIESLRHEKDALIEHIHQEKDALLAEAHRENNRLNEIIQGQRAELQEDKELLAESHNTQMELLKAMNKSSEAALAGYSEECINWLASGVKTVSIEAINHYTGHSKRKIANAITMGNLQTASRNKELVLVSSLVDWLKKTPALLTKDDQDTGPMARIPGDLVTLASAHNGHLTN